MRAGQAAEGQTRRAPACRRSQALWLANRLRRDFTSRAVESDVLCVHLATMLHLGQAEQQAPSDVRMAGHAVAPAPRSPS